MQSMSHDTLYSLLHITKGFIGRGRGANVSGLGPWVWCVCVGFRAFRITV